MQLATREKGCWWCLGHGPKAQTQVDIGHATHEHARPTSVAVYPPLPPTIPQPLPQPSAPCLLSVRCSFYSCVYITTACRIWDQQLLTWTGDGIYYIHMYICMYVQYIVNVCLYVYWDQMRGYSLAWLGLGCSAGRQLTVSVLHNQRQISKGACAAKWNGKCGRQADGVGWRVVEVRGATRQRRQEIELLTIPLSINLKLCT